MHKIRVSFRLLPCRATFVLNQSEISRDLPCWAAPPLLWAPPPLAHCLYMRACARARERVCVCLVAWWRRLESKDCGHVRSDASGFCWFFSLSPIRTYIANRERGVGGAVEQHPEWSYGPRTILPPPLSPLPPPPDVCRCSKCQTFWWFK